MRGSVIGRGRRPDRLWIALVAALLMPLVGCSGDEPSGRTSSTSTSTSTTVPPPIPVGAVPTGMESLSGGQCFVLPVEDAAADGRAVWVTDCAQPHTHEVYDVVDYGGPTVRGGAYPGITAVQDWSEQACFDRFEPFAGIPWTRSELEIQVWWPSAESWDADDRSVICTAFPQSGERTTGSQRGAAR